MSQSSPTVPHTGNTEREMRVKWHGKLSQPSKLPEGGAMGANLADKQ